MTGLSHRIEAMEADQEGFTALIAEITQTLTSKPQGLSSKMLCRSLRAFAALKKRGRDATVYAAAVMPFRKSSACSRPKPDGHQTELRAHLGLLGAVDLEHAARTIVELRRRNELQDEAKRAENDVLEMLQVQNLDAANCLFSAGEPEVWRQTPRMPSAAARRRIESAMNFF